MIQSCQVWVKETLLLVRSCYLLRRNMNLRNKNWLFTTLRGISDTFLVLECLKSSDRTVTVTWKLMGKYKVPLNPVLTIFGGGVWVISLLSGFISCHNFFTLLSEGVRGITTFGGPLLSKVYGMIKSRPSFPVYRLCFQNYLFSL